MKSIHRMQLPREVVIGRNTILEIDNILSRLNLKKKVLILTGERTLKIAGEKTNKLLIKKGFETEIEIVKYATLEQINELLKKFENNTFNVILGVGGGKIIDVTKMVSLKKFIPFISIPTTASHDGLSSPRASIRGANKLYSIQTAAPLGIIADIEIIMKAPYRLLASGCADLISNTTAVYDWKLANIKTGEYYGEYAASLANMCADLIIKNAELIKNFNEEGVRIVLESLISSGVAMSIAGSSRPASGGEHLFSHSLDKIDHKHALHGEQCGLGSIIMMYLQGRDWRTIQEALKIIGSPINAKELGLKPDDIIDALVYAPKIRKDRYTILNDYELDRNKAETILRKVEII